MHGQIHIKFLVLNFLNFIIIIIIIIITTTTTTTTTTIKTVLCHIYRIWTNHK